MGKYNYGVILDAGSSGTRVHIYRWLNSLKAREDADKNELNRLPKLKTKKSWTKKIHPGISTYAKDLELMGTEHLAPLIEHALNEIPEDQIETTPFFLLATAGVRLLPDEQRKALLAEVCGYVKHHTKFLLPDCGIHIQTIPGETEGLYGWIAANYLLGGFDKPEDHEHGKGHHTYGFLDMGGASAQIAFAPNATEAAKHKDDLRLLRLRTLDGRPAEYQVFVTTWLGFGVNEARKRYVEALRQALEPGPENQLPDPCLPVGLRITQSGNVVGEELEEEEDANEPHLVGTGKFQECLSQTFPLLDMDSICEARPCLLKGQHVPSIDFEVNHFVGVSEYWHTTHEIFEMGHKDKAYDLKTYQSRVNDFCSQNWDSIASGVKSEKWGSKVDETTAVEVCFKASWLINVLHDGIGVPRIGLETGHENESQNTTKEILDKAGKNDYLAPFQAINKIDDTEVSWTLGKMVLYASSQVPPENGQTLAVGFGSNVAGIPKDFEHAGGQPDVEIPTGGAVGGSNKDNEDDGQDWRHKLLRNPNLRGRTPGFLLFLLIVIVVALLLCGRERRRNLGQKLTGLFFCRRSARRGASSRQRNGGLASKFRFGLGGGNGSAKYERLAEEGEMPHPGDFELSAVSSDDESSSKGSHSSNSSAGRRRRYQPGGYFNEPRAGAFERGGLSVRPESRGGGQADRVAPRSVPDGGGGQGTGHRSRNGSPTRWRSPVLAPVKQSVD